MTKSHPENDTDDGGISDFMGTYQKLNEGEAAATHLENMLDKIESQINYVLNNADSVTPSDVRKIQQDLKQLEIKKAAIAPNADKEENGKTNPDNSN